MTAKGIERKAGSGMKAGRSEEGGDPEISEDCPGRRQKMFILMARCVQNCPRW